MAQLPMATAPEVSPVVEDRFGIDEALEFRFEDLGEPGQDA
ncbi:hypothetical protein [Leptolyngbya sp. FACHB-261]|nr:hypothetical protein [Leptolyngbya sp. FACHB-261]